MRLLFVLIAVSACAEVGELHLAATPGTTPADGLAIVEVTARARAVGHSVPDGTPVSFRADAPLLFASARAAEPAFPGARPRGELELVAPTRGSVATVYLLAPVEEGVVVVDARFTPEAGYDVGAALAVEFGAPPLVAAGIGALDAPGGVDVGFAFRCDVTNLGALVRERGDLLAPCRIVLEDAAGAMRPHVPVRLFAEAGELIEIPAAPDAPRGFFHVAPAPLTRYPADVRPIVDEEPYVVEGAGAIPGAIEQNPRDGLVTLLAVVRGAEAYADLDGDGAWSEGEPFVDEGEPFLDVDDDGVHDPAIDGPMCCDTNGNGVVDGPDGAWSGDVWLGRAAHVLWSGEVAEGEGRSGVAGPAMIDAGGEAAYTVTIVDGNYNPVAMFGEEDGVTLATVGPVAARAPDVELDDRMGMVIADEYPHARIGEGAVVEGIVVDGVRRFEVELEDARPFAEQCDVVDWVVEIVVRHTPGPAIGGVASAARSARIVREATLADRGC